MRNIFRFGVFVPVWLGNFVEQLDSLETTLRNWMKSEGMDEGKLLCTRIYLTDAANQWGDVVASRLYSSLLSLGAVSYIEQPLLDGAKVALQCCFVDEESLVKSGTPDCLVANFCGYRFLFHSVRLKPEECVGLDARAQTRMAFERHIDLLSKYQMTLEEHCHRTWIFVRDIDMHYADVVTGRNEIFAEQGLTANTHFISSTGIGGYADNRDAIVCIDFMSVDGLERSAVGYLKAIEYLNPTHEYGVAFERGTYLDLADERMLLISGTASIDRFGQCVHRGDVLTQAGRLFLNIEKLLNSGGSTLADIQYMVVYLRDIADYGKIRDYLRIRFPQVPFLVVEARVCRPEWLIEVECVAVKKIERVG